MEAGSSAGMISASGTIRLSRPVRTRPGPTSTNVRDAVGGHPLHDADPVDARRQVLDELRPAGLRGRQRTRVGVGEERRIGVVEGDARQRRPHALGRLGHHRRVGRDRDGQHDRSLGAQGPGELRAGLDRRTGTRDDHLAGGVSVGDDEDTVRRGAGDQLRQPGVVQADQGRHRAVLSLARRLHQPAALADQPDPVLERQRSGRDERRVLAHRMAGRERGPGRGDAGRGPSLAERGEDRDRGRQQGGLGVLGPVELFGGAIPGEGADRFTERRVRGGEDRCRRR